MFELKNVGFGYKSHNLLFENVNLSIRRNEFIILKGPSGSGKSTFLHLLNALELPVRGKIIFKGKAISEYESTRLRRRVVYMHQIPVMLDESVRENLLLAFGFTSAAGCKKPQDEILDGYLHKFLLDGVSLDDNALNLSVGQKQRLALIRAVLLKPEVLLLDEPTASLDPESRQIVEERLETLNVNEGVTIVMVNHTDYFPKGLEPRILVLEKGCLTEG